MSHAQPRTHNPKQKPTSEELPKIKISKREDGSRRVSIQTVGKSMTKQSFKDQCDINLIMKKHLAGDVVTHVNHIQGDYSEYPSGVDFLEAMNIVIDSSERFNELPSAIRDRFNNSPADFYDFVKDENNIDEMRDLGLIPKKKASETSLNPAEDTEAASNDASQASNDAGSSE